MNMLIEKVDFRKRYWAIASSEYYPYPFLDNVRFSSDNLEEIKSCFGESGISDNFICNMTYSEHCGVFDSQNNIWLIRSDSLEYKSSWKQYERRKFFLEELLKLN